MSVRICALSTAVLTAVNIVIIVYTSTHSHLGANWCSETFEIIFLNTLAHFDMTNYFVQFSLPFGFM